MHPTDLERAVGFGLRSLPGVPAPASLLPRVMAAVQAWAVRPWYERAWFTWPIPLRIASGAALIVLLIGAALAWPPLVVVLRGVAAPMTEPVLAQAGQIGGQLAGGAALLRALWGALIQPLLLVASPIVALMCVLCVTLGLAFSRFASGRAFQP